MIGRWVFAGMMMTFAAQAEPVEQSTFRQWSSYKLENSFITMHVAPALGGRIIGYALGDHQFLWSNRNLAGQTPPASGLDPKGGWLNWGGDKLWPAPQGWDRADQWPGPPDAVLDGSPHSASFPGGATRDPSIHLTSAEDQRSGIQLSRSITLYRGGTHVGVTATMRNIDTRPRRWGIWTVTQLDAESRDGSEPWNSRFHTYIPLTDGYRVLFGARDNPQFSKDQAGKLLQVHYQRRVGKVGALSTAGWVANVDGTAGMLFVQQFRHQPGASYPNDSTVEVWTQGAGTIHAWNRDVTMSSDPAENPNLVESELLGPLTLLAPGQETRFHYDWYAANIGGDYPVLSCNRLGCMCEAFHARAKVTSLKLTGRFGVFVAGQVRLAFYDAKGGQLREADPNPTLMGVAPTSPFVLSGPIAILEPVPDGVAEVALLLSDPEGKPLGELARTTIER